MSRGDQIERQAAPLRQQVVRLVREDILNGALLPGQRLVEAPLCARYAVSRTVIREALRQLESEYLVSIVPNRGPIVAVLTQQDIEAIYVVRARLEGLVGELFAEHSTAAAATALVALLARMETEYLHGSVDSREAIKAEFYTQMLEGAGNPVLAESLRGIHGRIAIFRRFAFVDEKRVALSMGELRHIVDAAAMRRDPDAARKACEDHIHLAGKLAAVEYEQRLLAEPQQQSTAADYAAIAHRSTATDFTS